MAGIGPSPVALATLFLHLMLMSSQLHFATAKPTGFSLRLIHRDSPESPLYPGNLTQVERIKRMINFTKIRAHYLASFSIQNATIDPNRFHVPLLHDKYFNYMALVSIGSQHVPVYLLLDTGGGLIWTQCEPCKRCYEQKIPLYNSLSSSTYKKLPCSHPLCQGNYYFTCVNGECVYTVDYIDRSITKGVASYESFKLGNKVFNNVIFGCSNDNQNDVFARDGLISGILGLSFSPESLVTQLSDAIHKRFSYCLVPFIDAMPHPSALRFGEDIPKPSGNIQTTLFIARAPKPYYYLNLLDISVGQRRLGFVQSTFAIKPDGSGGCVIDSGSTVTLIDQNTFGLDAYKAVIDGFQDFYDRLGLQRFHGHTKPFELCYVYSPGFNQFATMTYHFEGADYIIDGKYVNYFERDYFCVAVLPGSGISLLGAWHQQNMRIIYDGIFGELQFYTETCANDHLI